MTCGAAQPACEGVFHLVSLYLAALCLVGWWEWMIFVTPAPAVPQSAGNCVMLSH